VLNWGSPLLALGAIQGKIATAHQLIDGASVTFTQNTDGVILKLPPPLKDDPDRVIVLTVSTN
jgi:hypothetical protein